MATRSIPKTEWEQYFNRISKEMPAANVEMSVEGLDLGHQYFASKVPLEGITYDPASDMLTFFFEAFAHNVAAPRDLWVDERLDDLHSLSVVDSDGHQQIVVFHELLKLPPV
jgi:hypothetical protein